MYAVLEAVPNVEARSEWGQMHALTPIRNRVGNAV
jgi:hypothetical protein